MDASAYPRTTSYLRRLPAGLLSHPHCESKASLYREALRNLPRKLDLDGLDPLLADYVRDPLPMSSWVPEVVNTALYLAIADQIFGDDEKFLTWVSDFSQRVFEAPMYRVLMAVASPERLAAGGERRWNNFHTGVDYELKVVERGTHSRFSFPPYLYDSLALRATLKAIEAAYRASGARGATSERIAIGPTTAEFRIIWYPERPAR